jgi:O-antigen/teichoic acid export membrane protein
MNELKQNMMFSLILTGSRFLFPLITYPYAARILGPDKIGILGFSDSYSAYFILIAAIGIPLYGVKEIAKVKDQHDSLNKIFSEISIIYFLSTLLCVVGFFISILLVPQLRGEMLLNFLFSLNIVFTFLSFEWVFIGIEKFRYIAIRSLATKLIPVILIFFVVKKESDYVLYQLLSTAALIGNSLINIYFLRRHIQLRFTSINLKRHFGPLLNVFLSSAFISFYPLIDNLVLGFLYNFVFVGYYAAAVKINRIVGTIVASIGNVILPRVSWVISLGNTDQVLVLLNKSIRLTVFLTIPLSVSLFLMADDIISLLFGIEFKESVLPAQILSPMIIFMGLSNVYYWQILLPFSKEKLLLKLFFIVSVFSVVGNLVLSFKWNYLGSALATASTELILLVFSIILSKRVLSLALPWKYILRCFLVSLMFLPISYLVKSLFGDHWAILISSAIGCGLVYFGTQFFIFKDSIARDSFFFIKSYFYPAV